MEALEDPRRSPTALAALAVMAIAWPATAAPLAAWTPTTQLEIARSAASIAPPDLRRQIEKHPQELRVGVLQPFQNGDPARHASDADGGGTLDQLVLAETRGAIAAIRGHRPFSDIVRRLGRLSHYLADANNPLSASRQDPRESTYFNDYLQYVESAQGRFAVVFYGGGRALETREALPILLTNTLARSRNLYPEVGKEYRRIGAIRGRQLFDDRSNAFGVASLAFSHAVSDVAAVMRHVWIQGGGADRRRLTWTSPADASVHPTP